MKGRAQGDLELVEPIPTHLGLESSCQNSEAAPADVAPPEAAAWACLNRPPPRWPLQRSLQTSQSGRY